MRPRNGPRLPLLFACAALLLGISVGWLRAQTFSLITGREPVTSLDGLWRFHTGDNPRWASPHFDDSHWSLLRSDESWFTQGYKGYSGFAWYRYTVQVPDGSKDDSLLLAPAATSYQVFLDGKLLATYGKMSPTRNFYNLFAHAFAIPTSASGPRELHFSIRVWHSPLWAAFHGGGFYGSSYIGDSQLIAQRAAMTSRLHMDVYVNQYAYAVLGSLVGLAMLVLFLVRRSEREYIWFAMFLIANAAEIGWSIFASTTLLPLPVVVADVVSGMLLSGALFASLIFFCIVLHARRSIAWWLAAFLLAVLPITPALPYFGLTSVGIGSAVYVLCFLPTSLWILAILLQRSAQRDRDALLLLLPTLLFHGFMLVNGVLWITWQVGWQRWSFGWSTPLLRSPYLLTPEPAVGTLFIFGLLIFLVRRFSLARRHEERLAAEFEAARSTQSLLVPATAPCTPGFVVESVYLPASEVGGDFFQVQPGDDGSLLVVVGDVSGKGLKAAMTVSTIVGALRDYPARRPSEILMHLNRVLHGQIGGFVTCCAALIAADGALAIANAGHLSPYRNGSELAVAGGLPLGILAESSYEETSFQLAPGDRVTFMSDGVVEARNPHGELYGFDRTQRISIQPAAAIAETARNFGQEDDITVLTLLRAT